MPTEASNPGISKAQAALIASRALGKAQAVIAIALVERLDNGNPYYVVILGDAQTEGIVAIDARNGSILEKTTTTEPYNGWLTNRPATYTNAQLVWMPCQISLSPLYPFWRIVNGITNYVDRSGKTWNQLSLSGPG